MSNWPQVRHAFLNTHTHTHTHTLTHTQQHTHTHTHTLTHTHKHTHAHTHTVNRLSENMNNNLTFQSTYLHLVCHNSYSAEGDGRITFAFPSGNVSLFSDVVT